MATQINKLYLLTYLLRGNLAIWRRASKMQENLSAGLREEELTALSHTPSLASCSSPRSPCPRSLPSRSRASALAAEPTVMFSQFLPWLGYHINVAGWRSGNGVCHINEVTLPVT